MTTPKYFRHKSSDVPVMDKGKMFPVGNQSIGLGAGLTSFRFSRNNAKPGIPVTSKLMGDPPADLAARRANPGFHDEKPMRQIIMPKASAEKGGRLDLSIGGEWGIRVKLRLVELGWRYKDLVNAVNATGKPLTLSHLRNAINDEMPMSDERKASINAVLFGGEE